MKKLILVLLLLSPITTHAADLPVKAAPMAAPLAVPYWDGFYVGINGGAGFQQDRLDISGVDHAGAFAVATGLVPSQLNTRGGGGMFGGTFGYNYQPITRLVIGIEGDIDWTGIKGNDQQILTAVPAGYPLTLTTTGESKLSWLGTVRGRLGYLLTPTLMIYGTGGLAFGQVKDSAISTLTIGHTTYAAVLQDSATKTGWTAGAGFEHQFWGNWSVKAEYRYVDLGSNGGQFGTKLGKYEHDPAVTFAGNQGNVFQIGLVGLNYRFYP